MIDWITGFVSGLFGSWLFLAGVFFFAILAETYERIFWSSVLAIVTTLSVFTVFGLSDLGGLGWYTLGAVYVAGGIANALWRWFRSVRQATKEFNKTVDPSVANPEKKFSYEIRQYRTDTNFRENLDKIAYWVAAWPISFAAHFIGDMVLTLKGILVTFFSGLFDKISEKARGKAVIDVSEM